MDEINSKKLRVKRVIIDMILSSTIHGIPSIFKSKNVLIKILWTFFTCLSFGLCLFLFTENIKNYLQHEVTTKIRVINEPRSLFPTVTICNLNKFTSNVDTNTTITSINFPINPLLVYFQLIVQSHSQNISQKSDSFDKLIVLCEFNTKLCDAKNFRLFLHPKYGNCYQFNSGFNMSGNLIEKNKIVLTDRMFGLRLVLNTSVSNKLKSISPSAGALILIHNHTINPLMVEELTISSRAETNIALSRTFYSSYQKPYSECDGTTNDINSHDSEFFKLVHSSLTEYNQRICVIQCIQKIFITGCNCYFPNLPCFFESKACGIVDAPCLDNSIIFLEETNYLEEECIKKCPLECEKMKFDKTVTSNQFSNLMYEDFLTSYSGKDSKYFNKTVDSNDLAVVNIYYKTLDYISVTENPNIDLTTLLSNIGGIAGLFLGMSFLTLIEFIEFFIKILLSLTNSKEIHQSI